MKRIVMALVVVSVIGTVVAALASSPARDEDPTEARWTHANQLAVTLVARRAHVTADRVNCGEYGGYAREEGTCHLVRWNGQCERWRYDLRAGRRTVRSVERSLVPDERPDPDIKVVLCSYVGTP